MKPVGLKSGFVAICVVFAALGVAVPLGAVPPATTFNTFPLTVPLGSSEPAVTVGADGTTAVTALDSGPTINDFHTWLWKGGWNSSAAFQGSFDGQVGRRGHGGDDADVDIGSTGTLHAASLVVFFNAHLNQAQLGVFTVSCAHGDTSDNFAHCSSTIMDTAGTDRPWITSDGAHVYLAYRDAKDSSLVRISRSDDDGATWTKQGNPIVASGQITATETFNNLIGDIAVDPATHDVYVVINAGSQGIHKAHDTAWNNIFVSRSQDQGRTWHTVRVYRAALGVDLGNVFATLAVDPVSHAVYAGWSDGHTVQVAKSTDAGTTWTAPQTVNTGTEAMTAIFPAIAARNGTVDVAYYGSTGTSRDDTTGVWNTLMAKSTDAGTTYSQLTVSPHPIRNGALVRHLFADLFEVGINPQNGKAAIAYVDASLTSDANGDPMPQTVLAFEQ